MNYQPEYKNFKKSIIKNKSHVVWTKLVADLDTPVSAMMRIENYASYSFLLESFNDSIELRGLNFSYNSDMDVLKNVSLIIVLVHLFF